MDTVTDLLPSGAAMAVTIQTCRDLQLRRAALHQIAAEVNQAGAVTPADLAALVTQLDASLAAIQQALTMLAASVPQSS